MKCPACERGMVESKVYDEGHSVTSMGWRTYWDEKGMRHDHDPNERTHYCALPDPDDVNATLHGQGVKSKLPPLAEGLRRAALAHGAAL